MAALTNSGLLALLLLGLCQLHFVVAEPQQCLPIKGQPTCVCDTGAGIVNLTSLASTNTSSPR